MKFSGKLDLIHMKVGSVDLRTALKMYDGATVTFEMSPTEQMPPEGLREAVDAPADKSDVTRETRVFPDKPNEWEPPGV